MTFELAPKYEGVLSFPVSVLPFDAQINLMMKWAKLRLSRVVCVANVHMLMEGYWNPAFAEVLFKADLLTPDGMPLVWMMNLIRGRQHERVAGMDVLLALCNRAEAENLPVFFLGTDTETLAKMRQRLDQEFPNLPVAGMEPLPFRPLSPEEDRQVVEQINASGAGLLFVALGCPKQEKWMSQHRDRINAVMIGLGGVFPIYAGLQQRAPEYVRNVGLEWFYRLMQEPGRLWKRYATTIPPFVWLSMRQVMRVKVTTALTNAKFDT